MAEPPVGATIGAKGGHAFARNVSDFLCIVNVSNYIDNLMWH